MTNPNDEGTTLDNEEPEVLDLIDHEGSLDHGDTTPTELESERGYRLNEETDPDDDESGSDPE